jgi:hypothetical protein
MTFLSIALPLQTAIPVAQNLGNVVINAIRPLIGVLRAVSLATKSRQSIEEGVYRRSLNSILMLNRMANELDMSQPSLAAELRNLASRD